MKLRRRRDAQMVRGDLDHRARTLILINRQALRTATIRSRRLQQEDGGATDILEKMRREDFSMSNKIAALLSVASVALLAAQLPAQSAPLMAQSMMAKSATTNANMLEVRYGGWRGGWGGWRGGWGWGAGAFAAGARIGSALAAPYYYGGYYPSYYGTPYAGYGYYRYPGYNGGYPGYYGSYAGYYGPYRPYYGWRRAYYY
jgi:hypothetical protein